MLGGSQWRSLQLGQFRPDSGKFGTQGSSLVLDKEYKKKMNYGIIRIVWGEDGYGVHYWIIQALGPHQ
jgi:hypothetical protein